MSDVRSPTNPVVAQKVLVETFVPLITVTLSVRATRTFLRLVVGATRMSRALAALEATDLRSVGLRSARRMRSSTAAV